MLSSCDLSKFLSWCPIGRVHPRLKQPTLRTDPRSSCPLRPNSIETNKASTMAGRGRPTKEESLEKKQKLKEEAEKEWEVEEIVRDSYKAHHHNSLDA